MLVKDPWLPGVYLGIFLLLAGALFLPFAGFPANRRARNQWILAYSILLFLCYLIFRFFIQSKEPVPALQSSWFAPHVTVYIFSFILLGAATLLALYLLFIRKSARDIDLQRMDYLVYTGVAFFTFGMLFGALWAQEAWGHYWSWDPKETWSAVTWLCYLLYIHYRKLLPANWRTACVILLFAFLSLQICWWGVNYLPSAKGRSLHVY
jgi:ABC-type transport system involved in cytochrome c biogenesis permease subunit